MTRVKTENESAFVSDVWMVRVDTQWSVRGCAGRKGLYVLRYLEVGELLCARVYIGSLRPRNDARGTHHAVAVHEDGGMVFVLPYTARAARLVDPKKGSRR